MTTQTEALKLAREVLGEDRAWLESDAPQRVWDANSNAMIAIDEALAQQCVCGEPDSAGTHRIDGPCLAPQTEQEPVASIQHWCTYCQGHNAHNCQFNTQLPRVHTYTTNNTVALQGVKDDKTK